MRAFFFQALTQIVGLLALFLCYILGEVIVRVTSLPLPGALVGLIFLLGYLLIKRRIPETLARGARPLLSHMTVLFVPAVCAVVLIWSDIAPYLTSISIAIVISTAISLGMTAWLAGRIFGAASTGSNNSD